MHPRKVAKPNLLSFMEKNRDLVRQPSQIIKQIQQNILPNILDGSYMFKDQNSVVYCKCWTLAKL